MTKISTIIVVLLMATCLIPSGASATLLSFDPLSQEVLVGSLVDANLTISGLGDGVAPSLSGFDLGIGFDSAILMFDNVTFGDPILGDQLDLLGFGSITSVDASVPGNVNLFELSLDFAPVLDLFQAGSFTLATLSFEALALGTSSLDITFYTLADSLGNELPADVQSGSISAVPEPSTLLLLGSGLIGIPWFRKRWKKL